MIKIFPSLEKALQVVNNGKIKLLIINGKKVAIVNTEKGLRAFDNSCPHQHEPLHKGVITSFGEVVCALHQYRFNLTSGKEANNRCPEIGIYSLKITTEGVYIDL